jgi:tetraacyldisaccharide 4'-kinase
MAPLVDLPYRAGAALHRRWALGRPRQALPRFTVSIGALHFGGAGKTPLTLALAGEGDAILIRGYGGTLGDRHLAVVADPSDAAPWQRVLRGDGREATARQWSAEIGDEAALAAALRPGVPVGVGRSRELSCRDALALHDVRRVLLDDAFSHHRLRRDVDLLAVPVVRTPHGPRVAGGPMREGPGAAQRASAVVFVSDDLEQYHIDDIDNLKRQLRYRGPAASVGKTAVSLWSLGGEAVRRHEIDPGRRAVVVCALGRPDSLVRTCSEQLGAQVLAVVSRRDHHRFATAELVDAEARAARLGADLLLTSLKDAVRLPDTFSPGMDWIAAGCDLRWDLGHDAITTASEAP